MDRSLEEEANIYQVLFSNDLQLGQTPTSLRDFDKLIRIITTQPVTNVVLLQNVRAPSTVPKSVVKPCSNYVEGWVLQSPLSAALLLALSPNVTVSLHQLATDSLHLLRFRLHRVQRKALGTRRKEALTLTAVGRSCPTAPPAAWGATILYRYQHNCHAELGRWRRPRIHVGEYMA